MNMFARIFSRAEARHVHGSGPCLALLLRGILLVVISGSALARETYTPKPGSPVRQAICDGMRAYVLAMEKPEKLPQPIVFKIEYLKVMGDHAAFQGYALFKDGSPAAGVVLPDIVYTTFLQKDADGKWAVISDLSRTDVPGDKELRQIRKRFPVGIPTEIIPEFWREKLR
jgi:hypothetical protein